MRFNLISNVSNGVGLEQDARMLSAELSALGHQVAMVQFDHPQAGYADANVFLEVVVDKLFALAPRNYLVPNPEWFFPHWPLNRFDRVWAKTREAVTSFSARVNGRCRYLGWKARDLYQPEVKRERIFLHVQGKSMLKNTEAVIEGCKLAGAQLSVVSQQRGRLPDDQLAAMFNSHAYFLCPSEAEGYGMALHEALGCGAVVITTDAAPMNEIAPSLLVRPKSSSQLNFGTAHKVSPESVAEAVKMALAMSDDELTAWRRNARAAYERECSAFGQSLAAALKEIQ